MKTSERGIEAIAGYEGVKLEAYPDPGTGGEPITIGVGHTGGVQLGDVITEEQAMQYLTDDLKSAEATVNNNVRVPMSQHEFDALVSFVFNVGAGNFKSSTLLRMLNIGDRLGAANEFTKWNRAGGRILPGLVARRAAERAMFLEQP